MSLWIGAIPQENDPVWKLSSEKVPHMTMFYVGSEISDTDYEQVVLFVEHATKSFHSFGLSVDRRGTLGEDNADVLFFDKNDWSMRDVVRFKDEVAQNNTLAKLLAGSDQYDSWTPHLTVGYPEKPAHDSALDYPVTYISFGSLAVWSGDYDGPEFRLEEKSDIALTYADDNVTKFLEHHGTKGMKWGVRKDTSSGGHFIKPARSSLDPGRDAINKADKNRARTSVARAKTPMRMAGSIVLIKAAVLGVSPVGLAAISAGSATISTVLGQMSKAQYAPLFTAYDSSKGDIHIGVKNLNRKYSRPGNNLRENKKLQSKYNTEYQKIVSDALNKQKNGFIHPHRSAAEKILGKTSDNQYHIKFNMSAGKTDKPTMTITGPKGMQETLKLGEFRHADVADSTEIATYDVLLKRDNGGYITEFSIPALDVDLNDLFPEDEPVNHSVDDTTEDFLEHFGIRGMKWGYRRTREQLNSGASPTKGTLSGKHRAPGSEEGELALQLRGKVGKEGIHTLTNAELAFLTNRLNLEQNFRQVSEKVSGINTSQSSQQISKNKGSSPKKAPGFVRKLIVGQLQKQITGAADSIITTARKKFLADTLGKKYPALKAEYKKTLPQKKKKKK